MIKSFKDLNILISGANGFIGKNLVEALYKLGANVIVILHKNDNISMPVSKIFFDGSYESFTKEIVDKRIDVVIHLATYFLANHKGEQINDLIDANLKFGVYLLEISKQKEIPYFINTSTYAQYYDHKGYNPQNLYSATKQAFEVLMKYYEETSNIRFITLELTDTYGPGDTRPKFINLVLDAIKSRHNFNMSEGEQEICYLYIIDVVNAFIKCIELLISGYFSHNAKYSVYSDEIFKLKDLVINICDILNTKIEIKTGYYPYRQREIMTFKPTYPKLPDWNCENTLRDGIIKLINYKL